MLQDEDVKIQTTAFDLTSKQQSTASKPTSVMAEIGKLVPSLVVNDFGFEAKSGQGLETLIN